MRRYEICSHPDGTWGVMDFHKGRVAEMEGEFLNRLSFSLARNLMELLNFGDGNAGDNGSRVSDAPLLVKGVEVR